jgi:hypothetical protein
MPILHSLRCCSCAIFSLKPLGLSCPEGADDLDYERVLEDRLTLPEC